MGLMLALSGNVVVTNTGRILAGMASDSLRVVHRSEWYSGFAHLPSPPSSLCELLDLSTHTQGVVVCSTVAVCLIPVLGELCSRYSPVRVGFGVCDRGRRLGSLNFVFFGENEVLLEEWRRKIKRREK